MEEALRISVRGSADFYNRRADYLLWLSMSFYQRPNLQWHVFVSIWILKPSFPVIVMPQLQCGHNNIAPYVLEYFIVCSSLCCFRAFIAFAFHNPQAFILRAFRQIYAGECSFFYRYSVSEAVNRFFPALILQKIQPSFGSVTNNPGFESKPRDISEIAVELIKSPRQPFACIKVFEVVP